MTIRLVLAALGSLLVAFLLSAAEAAALAHVPRSARPSWSTRAGAARPRSLRIVADTAAYLSRRRLPAGRRRVRRGGADHARRRWTWSRASGRRCWSPSRHGRAVVRRSSGCRPRTLGPQHADRVALLAAPVLVWLRRVLGPVARLLIALGNAVTPGRGLPRRPVRDRGRAARPGRPGRRVRADRGRRARDDPLRLRARRHPRARGHGAAHRHGDDRPATGPCARRMSLFLRSGFSRIPVVGDGAGRRARPALPQGRRAPRSTPTRAPAAVPVQRR